MSRSNKTTNTTKTSMCTLTNTKPTYGEVMEKFQAPFAYREGFLQLKERFAHVSHLSSLEKQHRSQYLHIALHKQKKNIPSYNLTFLFYSPEIKNITKHNSLALKWLKIFF